MKGNPKNQRVLLTGYNGFLGRYIQAAFPPEQVLGIGRHKGAPISFDLLRADANIPASFLFIHAAGKAHHIPKNKKEEATFFAVNTQGIKNLLNVLEKHPPQRFVFISTVAVYGKAQAKLIQEDEARKPDTAYGKSKMLAEEAVKEWCTARNIPYLILRLPLIYGEQAPGNLGEMQRMIGNGTYVRIRNNRARKSMVLAEDVAKLIASWQGPSGVYHLTDGQHPAFSDLEDALAQKMGTRIQWELPLPWLKMAAKMGDLIRRVGIPFPLYSARLQKMTSSLTFSDEKARRELGWKPKPVLEYIRHS